MNQTDDMAMALISLFGAPYIVLCAHATLTTDIVAIKTLLAVGWILISLCCSIILIGEWIDR